MRFPVAIHRLRLFGLIVLAVGLIATAPASAQNNNQGNNNNNNNNNQNQNLAGVGGILVDADGVVRDDPDLDLRSASRHLAAVPVPGDF